MSDWMMEKYLVFDVFGRCLVVSEGSTNPLVQTSTTTFSLYDGLRCIIHALQSYIQSANKPEHFLPVCHHRVSNSLRFASLSSPSQSLCTAAGRGNRLTHISASLLCFWKETDKDSDAGQHSILWRTTSRSLYFIFIFFVIVMKVVLKIFGVSSSWKEYASLKWHAKKTTQTPKVGGQKRKTWTCVVDFGSKRTQSVPVVFFGLGEKTWGMPVFSLLKTLRQWMTLQLWTCSASTWMFWLIKTTEISCASSQDKDAPGPCNRAAPALSRCDINYIQNSSVQSGEPSSNTRPVWRICVPSEGGEAQNKWLNGERRDTGEKLPDGVTYINRCLEKEQEGEGRGAGDWERERKRERELKLSEEIK